MDRNAIIDGLKMTRDLCVFDPSTGEEIEPHLLNDINRTTYNACKGALEILEQFDTDSDTISRKGCLQALSHLMDVEGFRDGWAVSRANVECMLKAMPSAQPEIIFCKDCKKHNKHYHESPYKDTVCPLTAWRGKARGHEYDYQYCCYAERTDK